jgi:hypothetical protein
MIVSLALCVATGLYLGARHTAFALIPGSIAAAAVSTIVAVKSGVAMSTAVLLFFGLPFALQLGFLVAVLAPAFRRQRRLRQA